MMVFQWNALQRGDHVLVHGEADGGYPLQEAVVAMVDARQTAHEIGVRLLVDGEADGAITWPRRLLVHESPLPDDDRCWRCRANLTVPPPTDRVQTAPRRARRGRTNQS